MSSPRIRPSRRVAALAGLAVAASTLALPAANAAPRSASATTMQDRILQTVTLTNTKMSHWAVILRPVAAHRSPAASSPVVTTLSTRTGDGTQNLVLILGAAKMASGRTWYHVRLAILPNNSTGWLLRSALGRLHIVHTHLYVNRETETAVLTRDGRTIFTTRVGVGHSYWPTPAGQFYIRDELTDFDNAFYGPLAFGTSARSNVLTDWPGGGYIGVHGTSLPGLIPGHISHGCIRIVNSQILKLAQLMPVGTPLTVT
jgi:L,D-transpeptidase catalytic domain